MARPTSPWYDKYEKAINKALGSHEDYAENVRKYAKAAPEGSNRQKELENHAKYIDTLNTKQEKDYAATQVTGKHHSNFDRHTKKYDMSLHGEGKEYPGK